MKLIKLSFFIALLFVELSAGSQVINRYTLLNKSIKLYEKAEWDISVSSSFSNPYNATDISVDMLLTSPTGKELVLPCFYVKGDSTESLWKSRFSPQETGSYTYTFRVTAQGKNSKSQKGVFFSQNSDKKGFLHTNNNWTFRFDNGDLFRGIGEDVAWESRSWENPKWTYDYLLPTLSKNGANFFRTWMCAWNLPLEWTHIRDSKRYHDTNKYYNPSGIIRMDQLVEMADSLNLYIMLTLDWHGELVSDAEWKISPYNKANGGPAATPTEFFTSKKAQLRYKDKLRYIIARWGYSTHIAAWELFNEIDNAAFTPKDSVIIPFSAIVQWHNEMSRYLKKTDPYNHMVTTSISHRDIPGLDSLAYIDFNQKHIYKHTDKIASTLNTYTQSYNKPYVIGEFGYEWNWDVDFKTITKGLDFDYKRGLWYGLFSPTPILPMTWWWEFFDEQKMTPYFRSVKEISNQMLIAGKGSFKILQVQAGNMEAYGVQCGKKIFIYLLNNTAHSLASDVIVDYKSPALLNIACFIPNDLQCKNMYMRKIILKNSQSVYIPNITLAPNENMILILSPIKKH
jgi:hypothetical protein